LSLKGFSLREPLKSRTFKQYRGMYLDTRRYFELNIDTIADQFFSSRIDT